MKGIGGEPPTTPPTPHPIPGEMGENGKLIDLLLLSEHSTVVFRAGGKGTSAHRLRNIVMAYIFRA